MLNLVKFCKMTEFGIFMLLSLLVYDFLFPLKLKEVHLSLFSSPEVFPDGAGFSQLRPLTV